MIGTLNGQIRPVTVRDRGVEATEKTLQVTEGSPVAAGQMIATIEAVKMEAVITAPLGGTVSRLAINPVQLVEGGDLLLVIS